MTVASPATRPATSPTAAGDPDDDVGGGEEGGVGGGGDGETVPVLIVGIDSTPMPQKAEALGALSVKSCNCCASASAEVPFSKVKVTVTTTDAQAISTAQLETSGNLPHVALVTRCTKGTSTPEHSRAKTCVIAVTDGRSDGIRGGDCGGGALGGRSRV
eukprot:scaffold145623_cov27-Tisochrysis_lutea.AAC.1